MKILPSPSSNLRVMLNEEQEENIVASPQINLYPNPTKDQFTLIHNLLAENGEITLTIYDLMGRKLISKQFNDKEITINTTSLKAGVYFYTITQNNSTVLLNLIN